MRSVLLGLIVAILLAASAIVTVAPTSIDIARCPEDATLVGEGDFANGRWSRYVCGPARDDYSPWAGLPCPDPMPPGIHWELVGCWKEGRP